MSSMSRPISCEAIGAVPLRVLMSSTSYPEGPQDWRGRFIANLVTASARRDDIALSLWAPPGALPANVASISTPSDAVWLDRLSRQGGIAHLLRTRHVLALGTILGLMTRLGRAYRRQPADVAHVNWLQNALPLWGTNTPALIAVLGTDFGLLRLPGMKMLLRAVLRQRRAILAPNAEWMRPELERAFGDVAEIRPIAFGVDDTWFEVARRPLEGGARHWLAVTRLTENKIGDLFRWGDGFFGQERQLHLFGPMQEAVELPAWVQYHGPAQPADLLERWFPLACGLISLSRHDEGQPQVMLEAMAAGLPVVASDLPAHRGVVQHRRTGWLAATPHELGQGLDWLDDPLNNQHAGQAAREWARECIGTWADCADRYAATYRQLLEPTPVRLDAMADSRQENAADQSFDSVCAIVVTYFPDQEFDERLRRLLPQVAEVVIVDNTPRESGAPDVKELLPQSARVHLIENGANVGISKALNQGLKHASSRGYKWILTLDQDTCCFPYMVNTLLAVSTVCKPTPAVIGANYFDPQKDCVRVPASKNEDFLEQKTVITSGSLIDVDFAASIGGFREDFFIDQVDHEFCLRARAHGRKVVITRKPMMTHSVGRPGGVRIPFLGALPNHPPVRKYYIARNTLVMVAEYWRREPEWCLRRLVRLLLGLGLMALLEEHPSSKVRAFAGGIVDAVRRRMGPCSRESIDRPRPHTL